MISLDASWMPFVLATVEARAVRSVDVVQELWSGYGAILRVHLEGANVPSVIVKRVRWPTETQHPRGWNTSRSHERKVRSYAVEAAFYVDHANALDVTCRTAELLGHEVRSDGVLMVLEDLDIAGFAGRRTVGDELSILFGRKSVAAEPVAAEPVAAEPAAEANAEPVNEKDMHACLQWLAAFHAKHLGQRADELWPIGTYWHLDTRPDEYARIAHQKLKDAADALDVKLNTCKFQTLLHGDAKLANFCFSTKSDVDVSVAALDFQYAGGGCGIKDVAYFIGSCLGEKECGAQQENLLDVYFAGLLAHVGRGAEDVDLAALENEWRALYATAWTDFYRFLAGWSPAHWKIHDYTLQLADEALGNL